MKKIGYLLFAVIFNICKLFPVKIGKNILFNGHNHGLNGNLLQIKKGLMKAEASVEIKWYAKKDMFSGGGLGKIKGIFGFFILLPFQMATAEIIFLNDNFLPLAYCYPSKRTKIVQLWHGAGAFKKFGLSTETDERVKQQVERANSRLTHLFVTSEKVIPFYQEAFGIKKDRIYVTGIPVTDVYFEQDRKEQAQERFYKIYPELHEKRLLLYTPTFRRTSRENLEIMEHFPMERLQELLGDSWVVLVKMHPKYPVSNIPRHSFCYDMTNYAHITDLYFVSDLLVTDYSSTVVEYVLLDKPVILYAYDLEEYDRGFYREYESSVPGEIAQNEEELLALLSGLGENSTRRQAFADMQYDYKDNGATERILSVLKRGCI